MDNIEGFTVLENKAIGRNFFRIRKVKDIKAKEVAIYLGMQEPTYTKYERGESKITIELIQKIAEFYKVDPLQLLTASPGNFIENVTNSSLFSNFQTFQTYNEEQNKMMLQLMESIMNLNARLVSLLEKKGE